MPTIEKNINKVKTKNGKIVYRVNLVKNNVNYFKTFNTIEESRKYIKDIKEGKIVNGNKLRKRIGIEKNITKLEGNTNKIVYRVDLKKNNVKYSKSFDTLEEARKYIKDIEEGKIVKEKKDRKKIYIEKNIRKVEGLNTYYVRLERDNKVFSKTFDNLEEARKYKNSFKNIVPIKKIQNKKQRLETISQNINVNLDSGTFYLRLNINKNKYIKSSKNLNELIEYRNKLLKENNKKIPKENFNKDMFFDLDKLMKKENRTKEEKSRLDKILKKGKFGKIPILKKPVFEKPKIYKRKPKSKEKRRKDIKERKEIKKYKKKYKKMLSRIVIDSDDIGPVIEI